jgi:hypothetical protein
MFGTSSGVLTHRNLFGTFFVHSGLNQGGVLSSLLFNFALEYVISIFKDYLIFNEHNQVLNTVNFVRRVYNLPAMK